jgi:hypothetical protein
VCSDTIATRLTSQNLVLMNTVSSQSFPVEVYRQTSYTSPSPQCTIRINNLHPPDTNYIHIAPTHKTQSLDHKLHALLPNILNPTTLPTLSLNMSPRSLYTPLHAAPQGVGGNNNLGIIVVRYTHSRRTCIEKRIRPSAIRLGDIQREIRIMQQVRAHPNIVCILDYDLNHRTLGYGSVFMQHGELGSLDALIGRFRARRKWIADEGFAWKVLWDLCIGLAYLWTGQDAMTVRQVAAAGEIVMPKRGWSPIIHRDVKPSNVFLTWHDSLNVDTCPYPTVLMGDLGCAVTAQDVGVGAALPQNDVEFAPPEFPSYSEYGDVYALALVVVCIGWIKQRPPKKHPLNGWASEGMNMVLKNCLAREQRARPSPGELPKYVWRGYQTWCRGPRDFGSKLPDWALGG